MQILWPVFALFLLTAFVAFRLGFMRYAAVRRGEIDADYFRAYRSRPGREEPERLAVASRHLINLFEAPTLFYVVAILIYVTGQTSLLLLGLAWLYVAARYLHSYIHLTSNVVIHRFRVFASSWVVLAALWLVLLLQLLLHG